MPEIHRTAIVEDGAQLADDVKVGPYAYVGPHVVMGPGCELRQGAIVEGHTTLGAGNTIFPYAVIGSEPQDRKYEGEPSKLVIGDHNVIREYVSIHIGTEAGGGLTKLGNKNLVMGTCHVAHDCIVGDHCILANGAGLAGHVILEDWVIVGGQSGIHQFVRLGAHCMTSGGSKVGKDIPPFTMAQGYPARVRGINHVGLRRRGFSEQTVRDLRQVYRQVFFDEGKFDDLVEQAKVEFKGSHEVQRFLDFLVESSANRGFIRPVRGEEDENINAPTLPPASTNANANAG